MSTRALICAALGHVWTTWRTAALLGARRPTCARCGALKPTEHRAPANRPAAGESHPQNGSPSPCSGGGPDHFARG